MKFCRLCLYRKLRSLVWPVGFDSVRVRWKFIKDPNLRSCLYRSLGSERKASVFLSLWIGSEILYYPSLNLKNYTELQIKYLKTPKSIFSSKKADKNVGILFIKIKWWRSWIVAHWLHGFVHPQKMGIIERNHVPIPTNYIHVLVYAEGSVAITCAGLFSDYLGFFVIENYLR